MRSLSIGYFLSVINALIFIFPTILFYPVLATYPASIILRGVGWRILRHRLGNIAHLHVAIWGLGALTYASIILSFFEYFEQGVWVALTAWAAYSILEAALYLGAASRLKVRLLFASPISLIGVGALVSVLLMSRDIDWFAGEIRYGGLTALFFGGAACLAASALITAIAALRIGAEKPTGEKELESLLVAQPRATPSTAEKTQTQRPQPTAAKPPQPTAARQPTHTSPKASAAPKALIHLEVISRGDMLVCPNCGASAAIGADTCPSCGEPFKKASEGLRCPVCLAPFSMAKQLSRSHYVCGQCFSDLRLSGV